MKGQKGKKHDFQFHAGSRAHGILPSLACARSACEANAGEWNFAPFLETYEIAGQRQKKSSPKREEERRKGGRDYGVSHSLIRHPPISHGALLKQGTCTVP